jgi:hypothetical protein
LITRYTLMTTSHLLSVNLRRNDPAELDPRNEHPASGR